MDFIIAGVKVIVAAFVLFTVARVAFLLLAYRSPWGWVSFVGILATANMLFFRMLGDTITPPFFASVLFAIALYGFPANPDSIEGQWFRRAVYAVGIGTILGWGSFAEIVQSAPSNCC